MKRLPPRGKLSAKRTDEGQTSHHNPFLGDIGTAAPHPAFGHLPPVGEGFSHDKKGVP